MDRTIEVLPISVINIYRNFSQTPLSNVSWHVYIYNIESVAIGLLYGLTLNQAVGTEKKKKR